MNTAIVTTAWRGGGTERYCMHLAEVHRSQGWTPTLYLEESLDGTPDSSMSMFATIETLGSSSVEAELQFTNRSISLVHLNVWSAAEKYKFCENAHKWKTLQTFHATFPDVSLRSFLKFWRVGQLYRRILFLSKQIVPEVPIICISGRNLTRANLIYPKLKKAFIYNGVNDTRERGSPDGALLWIGSFVQRKDPLLALHVLDLLRLRGRNFRLEMIGDGPMLSKCRAIASAKSLPITFSGRRQSVSGLLQGKSVLIITSRDEGIPYVVAEAFAAGIPVISTNCGAVSEVINGRNGIICNSAQKMCDSICQVLRKNEYSKFTSEARISYTSFFSFEKFANETVQFSRELLNEPA